MCLQVLALCVNADVGMRQEVDTLHQHRFTHLGAQLPLLSCQAMRMFGHSAEVLLSLTAALASPPASHADTAACHSHAGAPQPWSGQMYSFSQLELVWKDKHL